MTKQECFQKNLDLLAQNFNPELSNLLSAAKLENLEFCENTNGEANLVQKIEGREQYFYSQDSCAKEANNWFSSLNLEKTGVLFVYGIGLGYYYEAIKPWLRENPETYLAFIEDDIDVLHRFLESENCTELLQDPQVIIHYIDRNAELSEQLNPLLWFFAFLEAEISSLAHYKTTKSSYYEEIYYFLESRSARLNCIVEEEMHYGISFYKNFYYNIFNYICI